MTKAVDLLRGLHKAVLDLSEHFEKPITDDNVTRWLALNSAQEAVRTFLDSGATPPEERANVIEECAALCDALKERSEKAYNAAPGMEHHHPQVKGEWEASKVLADQIRALKAGVSPQLLSTDKP